MACTFFLMIQMIILSFTYPYPWSDELPQFSNFYCFCTSLCLFLSDGDMAISRKIFRLQTRIVKFSLYFDIITAGTYKFLFFLTDRNIRCKIVFKYMINSQIKYMNFGDYDFIFHCTNRVFHVVYL